MNADDLPVERFRMTEAPRTCSYLNDETASLEYRIYPTLTPAEVEFLYERGWRRFGAYFFRPACASCSKCVPIRVNVEQFQPSKSQRKTLRRNEHISVQPSSPAVTRQHIDLYNRWHAEMTAHKGWREQQSTLEEYADGFHSGHFPSLHEIRYFDGEKLVGVGLVDVLPDSLSSAYFYHDPAWRPLGPGTFSLLCEISLAKSLNKKYLYLGYWISQCPSMAYKNRFSPSETLSGSPEDQNVPRWKDASKTTLPSKEQL